MVLLLMEAMETFTHRQVDVLMLVNNTCKLDAHKPNFEKASRLWGEFTNFQGAKFWKIKDKGFLKSWSIILKGLMLVACLYN